jgi:MFS family permease
MNTTTATAETAPLPPTARAGWWAGRFGGLPTPFWHIMGGVGLARLGFVVVPFLAFWLSTERHISPAHTAWVMTAFGTGWMISTPLGGWLADRVGRRATVTASATCAAGAYLLLGGVTGLPTTIAAAALTGLCFDLYRPGVQAALVDTVAADDHTRALSLLYLVMNLSRLAACALGGLLAGGSGFRWLFALNAASNLGLAFAAHRVLPRRDPQPAGQPRPQVRSLATDRAFTAFTLITLVFYAVHMQSMVALPVVLGHAGATPGLYGLLLALDPLVVVVVQLLAQQWLTRTPGLLVCALGVATVGTGLALTGLSPTLGWAAATIPIWVSGEVAFLSAAPGVIATLAPPALRGSYFGWWAATQGAAAVAAPLLAAWLAGTDLIWIAGGLAGLAAAAGCLALQHTRPISATHPTEGPAT